MTEEQQIRLANAWAVNREAERRLQIRDCAKAAVESDYAYHGGYIFPVMTGPHLRGLQRDDDPLPALNYRDIMVRLSPTLQGTAAAQLIAERIIEEQWPEKA